MSKIWKFIKDKFFKKEFIIFCVIGVLNTLVNAACKFGSLELYELVFKESSTVFGIENFFSFIKVGVTTFIAFVLSSIFSYFMNAKFTYKEKTNSKNAVESAVAFILRYVFTYLLELLLLWLVSIVFTVPQEYENLVSTIVNFIASLAMVPPFYLVFKLIFKGKDKKEDAQN